MIGKLNTKTARGISRNQKTECPLSYLLRIEGTPLQKEGIMFRGKVAIDIKVVIDNEVFSYSITEDELDYDIYGIATALLEGATNKVNAGIEAWKYRLTTSEEKEANNES